MKSSAFEEDPLESFLDSESEAEFGEPEIRNRFDHGADEAKSGNLRDWSAQDFASIYVRFRPHLERHAKRYLSNPVQAEEVVQDAFLYLMTSLPQLDTELGVLKFLKWKIKLLSYDILSSAAHLRETPVAEHHELESEDLELSADLERAEDNAVIQLALARLNPRQREALLASVYEEKSSEEIAEHLGMSANAARQLIFRARTAFRRALVGEAEIKGKSVSQVLSIAANKAALSAQKNATQVGVLLIFAAIGVGIVPSMISTVGTVGEEIPESLYSSEPSASPQQNLSTESQLADDQEDSSVGTSVPIVEVSDDEPKTEEAEKASEVTAQEPAKPEPEFANLNSQALGAILTTNISNAGVYTESAYQPLGVSFTGIAVEVFGGTGISAFLDFDAGSKYVNQIIFQMQVEQSRYYGVPTTTDYELLTNDVGFTLAVIAKEFYVVDDQGNVLSDSILSESEAVVTLELSPAGMPESASLKIEALKQ